MTRQVFDRDLRQWTITAKQVINPEDGTVLSDHAVGPGMSLVELEQRIRDTAALSARVAVLGEQMQVLGLFASALRAVELFNAITDARDAIRAARLELLGAQSPDREVRHDDDTD
jgi:hypothetical protein